MTHPTRQTPGTSWNLSPSDFSFLWQDCRRCFYLKVVHNLRPPKGPMPAMFTKIAGLQDRFFQGKRTEELVPSLPPGTFSLGERKVRSQDIVLPGRSGKCHIAGRFDAVVEFDDGTYGVVDFKTSETKAAHQSNYSRQLHAYAHALENPAPRAIALSPIRVLGLVCLDVVEFGQGRERKDVFYLRCNPVWIPFDRDQEGFLGFIGEVLDVLELPAPPPAAPGCKVCQHRADARALGPNL